MENDHAILTGEAAQRVTEIILESTGTNALVNNLRHTHKAVAQKNLEPLNQLEELKRERDAAHQMVGAKLMEVVKADEDKATKLKVEHSQDLERLEFARLNLGTLEARVAELEMLLSNARVERTQALIQKSALEREASNISACLATAKTENDQLRQSLRIEAVAVRLLGLKCEELQGQNESFKDGNVKAQDLEQGLRCTIARLNSELEASHRPQLAAGSPQEQASLERGSRHPVKTEVQATALGKRSFGRSSSGATIDLSDDATYVPDDEVVFVEPTSLVKYAESRYLRMVPERRRRMDGYPEDLEEYDGSHVEFRRSEIRLVFEGNPQTTVVKITESMTQLARSLGVNQLLCTRLDNNPWLPLQPGQHGIMQVGLFGEHETFAKAQTWLLFAGHPTSSGPDQPLSVDEWKLFPEEVKQKFSAVTAERNKRPGSSCPGTPDGCREAYDLGIEVVPAVRLIYQRFPQALQDALAKFKVHGPQPETHIVHSNHDGDGARSSPRSSPRKRTCSRRSQR